MNTRMVKSSPKPYGATVYVTTKLVTATAQSFQCPRWVLLLFARGVSPPDDPPLNGSAP